MESLPVSTEAFNLRRKAPLAVLGGLCAVLSYFWILSADVLDFSLGSLPLLGMGSMAVVLTFLDLRIGLGLMVFSMGVSPEFQLWGIANLRLEDFLFTAILLAWLFRFVAGRERFSTTNLTAPLLLTVLLSLLSSIYNSIYSDLDLVSCGFRLAKLLEYFLMFAITLNTLRRQEDLRAFVYMMPLVSALVGIHGIFQSIQTQGRVTGPLGETSNILGGYYVFHICLVLGLLASGAKYRLPLLASAGLLILPLLYTMSRTSYVALFAGLLAMLAARRNLWTAMTVGAFLLAIFASAGITDRFLTIVGLVYGEVPNSLMMRARGWITFLEYLPEAPILGQGMGNKSLGAFDNEYVRQLFELGVFGLVLFFWMALRVLRTSFRLSRRAPDPAFSGFALGCFGATVAYLVHSLAATTFTTIRTTEPFFFASGILYSIALHCGLREFDREDFPVELPARPRGARPLGLPAAAR